MFTATFDDQNSIGEFDDSQEKQKLFKEQFY